MGWTFGWGSKDEVVDHLDRGCSVEIAARKVGSSGLWRMLPNGEIYYDMISSDGDEWGYKDQSVNMGIYVYDCPKGWLKKAKVEGYGEGWLMRAKLYHNLERLVGVKNCIGIYRGTKLLIQTEDGPRWQFAKDFLAGLSDGEVRNAQF